MSEYNPNIEILTQDLHHSFKKSWLAYLKTSVIFLFIFLIGLGLTSGSTLFTLIVSTIIILIFIYKILYIKSFELYTNEEGIWVYSGVFPWEKGISGVKWRDLDDAVFFQGMISYFCKSYSVSIRHRYTKSNEIFLTHISHGNQAVATINQLHQNLLQNGMLH